MTIFNIFRGGYLLGQLHANNNQRRKANWEILASRPLTWIPFFDSATYLKGYDQGYKDALANASLAKHLKDND